MTDFIDKGFRPNLDKLIEHQRHKYTCERLQITPNAFPVPSMKRQRVGVWFGSLLSKNGEFPIVAVAVNKPSELRPEGNWFYGSAHHDLIVGSDAPLVDMVDSALLRAVSVGYALTHLASLFPTDSFTENPRKIDLGSVSPQPPKARVDWEPYVTP